MYQVHNLLLTKKNLHKPTDVLCNGSAGTTQNTVHVCKEFDVLYSGIHLQIPFAKFG